MEEDLVLVLGVKYWQSLALMERFTEPGWRRSFQRKLKLKIVCTVCATLTMVIQRLLLARKSTPWIGNSGIFQARQFLVAWLMHRAIGNTKHGLQTRWTSSTRLLTKDRGNSQWNFEPN